MKKKILFITDSLGLPRLVPEKVLYEETYIVLLKEKFPEFEFISLNIGGGEITTLYNQLFYYKALSASLVFVQSGIVDCAPRAFSPVEKAILNSNSTVKKVSKYLLKPLVPFLRKIRKTQSTKITVFREFVRRFKSEFKGIPLYWLSIIPATDGYEKGMKGISSNINAYNKVLLEENGENYIDNSEFNEDMVLSDHHHLNTNGHATLCMKLSLIIDKLNFYVEEV